MVLLITRISINEFNSLKDKREYISSEDCKFFDLHTNLSKKDIYDLLEIRISWYSIWSNIPIYINIISNNYWRKIGSNLMNSRSIVKYTDIPSIITFDNDEYYNNYHKEVTISDRICLNNTIKNIINNIKTFNFKNNDIYQIKLG